MLARAAFPPDSHDGKALIEILETLPARRAVPDRRRRALRDRDRHPAPGERQRVRLFVRRDTFGRFLSCLVFVPARPLQHREPPAHPARSCVEAFRGRAIDYTTRVSESVLARLHFMVYTEPGASRPTSTPREIEARLAAATRSWADDLERRARRASYGEERGIDLRRRYGDAFPAGLPRRLRALGAWPTSGASRRSTAHGRPGDEPLPPARGAGRARCAPSCSAPATPLALSDVLPVLENMGVKVIDERPYEVDARATARRSGSTTSG